MLNLTRKNNEKNQQSANGKLISPEVNHFKEVTLQIQQLTQHVGQLETQAVLLNQQTQQTTLEQFNAVKLSVKRIGKLYGGLLGLALGTTFGLTAWLVWADLNPKGCSQSFQEVEGAIASIAKPQTSESFPKLIAANISKSGG
ncbi:MAG: hypothetical protein SW833_10505 [Cyanobacteriota bacterium]|nr:hypothetical protein [Cyanobacteriota bacterium]